MYTTVRVFVFFLGLYASHEPCAQAVMLKLFLSSIKFARCRFMDRNRLQVIANGAFYGLRNVTYL